MLRSASSGKASLGPLLPKISSELIASELTPMIWTELLDVCIVLSSSPGGKGLVGSKSLIFGSKNVEYGELSMIICEGYIVVTPS